MDWCCESNSETGADGGDERKYLKAISVLCEAVCLALLEDQCEKGVLNFTSYRKNLAASTLGCWVPLRSMTQDTTESIALLQDLLDVAPHSVQRHVKNIYAERKSTGEIIDFKADEKVLAAARGFRNEVRRG